MRSVELNPRDDFAHPQHLRGPIPQIVLTSSRIAKQFLIAIAVCTRSSWRRNFNVVIHNKMTTSVLTILI